MDTTDVDVQYMHTISVHGREYQKYALEHNVHFLPVDEDTAEHLEAHHRLFRLIFDDKIIYPPVDTPRRVLDLGYGAANWAVEIAEQYPKAQVIVDQAYTHTNLAKCQQVVGVDISCHMLPDEIPDNFQPQIHDLNLPLSFPSDHFDIVASRAIGDGISKTRWPSLVKDISRILRPGAWVQFVEYYNMMQSDNGSISTNHALRRWSTRYMRSIDDLKNPRIPMALQTELAAAGFVNIESKMIVVPLCGWHTDPKKHAVGLAMQDLIEEHLRMLSLLPFTKRTFMPVDEFEALIRDAVREARTLALKAYIPLYVVVGQKPSS